MANSIRPYSAERLLSVSDSMNGTKCTDTPRNLLRSPAAWTGPPGGQWADDIELFLLLNKLFPFFFPLLFISQVPWSVQSFVEIRSISYNG
jgi:hypothetical protein